MASTPGQESGADWARRDAAVVWHGFTPMDEYLDGEPIVVDRAEGHELIDVDGRRYLDAISSLWVNTLGHHVPELDDAVRRQLDLVAHSTLLGHGNRVVIELAEALAAVVPVDDPRFLFAGDGASAVEQALKVAFQYWVNVGRPERRRFLAFGGAYHGDTIGALSLGDGGLGADVFDPLRFPVLRAPGFDDDPGFKVAVDMVHEHAGELAAVVVEPLVQGAAGMRMAPAASFAHLAAACRETGVLLVYDEVATGFGRTGTLFAADQCGGPDARPDVLGLGKGLTAGYLAMSATVVAARVADAFGARGRHLAHGHSYGGNALAAAVALRHLRLLDEWRVLDNVAARSDQLRRLLDDRIRPLGGVLDVRLCGLMGGVDVEGGADGGRRVCAVATRAGVLLRPLGETVVLMPPLTVTEAEVERLVDVLADAIP
ncbi:MAG: adenosylmethionine---8-amino-7-oxononanoate aminotransferase [Actinomycetota bacterium]|nr:adenosylmethionine---8-amino-7-oxononanoate aminotransferase [Actinomycetota bacterium]